MIYGGIFFAYIESYAKWNDLCIRRYAYESDQIICISAVLMHLSFPFSK